MKNVLILIQREFLIFFKNIASNLFFYFLFPILTYLFIVLLFSNLFDLTKDLIKFSDQGLLRTDYPDMKYLYYATPAILFVCTSMIAFISPIMIIMRDKEYSSYMYTTKLNQLNYFSSIIISVTLFSYIEFIIALIISTQLSNIVFVSWMQIFYFFIIIFPFILFFLTLGLLISNFIKTYEGFLITSIFLFLLLSFGSFTFVPIDYFSEKLNYVLITKSYNLIFHLYDMFISIFENKSLGIQTFIISIFLSIVFYFSHIIINSKKNKENR